MERRHTLPVAQSKCSLLASAILSTPSAERRRQKETEICRPNLSLERRGGIIHQTQIRRKEAHLTQQG